MTPRLICLTSALALTAGAASAEMNFNRVASFATFRNMAAGEDQGRATSAEIIAATPDGNTVIYTDSPLGVVGLVDITDPKSPAPLGNIDMKGEPTSVTVIGDRAYVAVNTSESFATPSGRLAVIDITARREIASCDLGGQPDSIAAAHDGSFLSIAIENERDEEAGDGRVGQMPAGYLAMVGVAGDTADCASLTKVDVTGLAQIAPEDPEPEFVSINSRGDTVLTLQENNELVIIDKAGRITGHFSMGKVDLQNVDTEEEGALTFDGTLKGVVREADGVHWIDDDHFATANEGDMDGGSRGWTVWNRDGSVVWESGLSLEYAIAQIGHYPEKRSGNKGVEPEGVEVGTFAGTPMVFIGTERASVIGVYDATDPAHPVLKQLLPSGIGPEGFVAIPNRNLLVSANEEDLGVGLARSHITVFEYQDAPAAYPQLTSAGIAQANGAPVGWGAVSGQVAAGDGFLYAVEDSFFALQPTILKIDVSQKPARIVDAIRVTRGGQPAQKLDMEGITTDGKGGFWVASEGDSAKLVPHALYHVSAKGEIKAEIGLPPELLANETRFGFEGVTRIGNTLWMAVQREWKDDPKGQVKLVSYDLDSKEWGAVAYPLDTPAAGWVGLSDIVAHGEHVYVVERDNQVGEMAAIKRIYRVALNQLRPAPLGGDDLPRVEKELVRDLIPDLTATGGFVLDKVEGLAIQPDGTAWVSTDNDGVDDHSGETMLFSMGKLGM